MIYLLYVHNITCIYARDLSWWSDEIRRQLDDRISIYVHNKFSIYAQDISERNGIIE